MHVYTIVKLKLNRIGFLIVRLRLLDNLIVSRVMYTVYQVGILCSAHAEDLLWGL